jgi:hypothetical protein
MKKSLPLLLLLSLVTVFFGCVGPYKADKAFYDSKILTIEINTEVLFGYPEETAKFKEEVLKQLNKKSYKTIVKDLQFEKTSGHPTSQIKDAISKSVADSYMILKVGTSKSSAYSSKGEFLGLQLTKLNCHYYLYNRNSDLILMAPLTFYYSIIHTDTHPIYRKKLMYHQNLNKALDPNTANILYTESENDFRLRIAEELTQNIPSRE